MRTCLFLLTVFFLTLSTSTLYANTIHVPADSSTIQGGINGCVDGDTVLVAYGTYTGSGNRDIDFGSRAIVVMSESGPESCVIDCQASWLDEHRGFYFHSGEGSKSVLMGFTITNGNYSRGGGIYITGSSPTVTNCKFQRNSTDHGGGIYNTGSSPTVTNCVFNRNTAGAGNGGGMCNVNNSNPTVTNCIFNENDTGYFDGGGMYNGQSSSPTVTNCTFSGNWGDRYGGGMCNVDNSNPTVTNCTFSGNEVWLRGSGMYNSGSNPTVSNCILWGDAWEEFYNSNSDPIVTYSNVQGGYKGKGNIDDDPLFMTYKGYDYLLDVGSPCIDTGDPLIEDGISNWHPSWPVWLPNGPRSDMGAYGGPGNKNWATFR